MTHILHHANGLLGLRDKLIFRLLDLFLRLRAELRLLVVRRGVTARRRGRGQLPCGTLGASLGSVQAQARVLNVLAGACGKQQVSVERRVPAGQEAALNLVVLSQASLAHALLSQGVLLKRRGQGVLAGICVCLVQRLAAGQRCASNGVREGLGLRLRARGRREGGLGLGRAGGRREERHLLADGAAEVRERLLDVGRVVVGLSGILVANGFLESVMNLRHRELAARMLRLT